MRRLLPRSSAALFAVLMMTAVPKLAPAQQSGLTTLAALKVHMRPLLVFAPRPNDPQLEIQIRTLNEHAAEAQERDLVAIGLPYQNPSPTPLQLSSDEAEAARRKFHVAPTDFLVILIGKDGGAKLRSTKPLSMNKLSAAIDAMPMRQDEIKAKQQR